MPDQIGWLFGPAVLYQVVRTGDDDARAGADFPRDQRGIGERADADGEVDAGLHQVDIIIIEYQVDADVGVGEQKFMKVGNDESAAKSSTGRKSQGTGGFDLAFADTCLGFLKIIEDADTVAVIFLARFRELYRSCAAVEQFCTKAFFECGDMFTYRGLRHIGFPRYRREVFCFDDAAENRHTVHYIHKNPLHQAFQEVK